MTRSLAKGEKRLELADLTQKQCRRVLKQEGLGGGGRLVFASVSVPNVFLTKANLLFPSPAYPNSGTPKIYSRTCIWCGHFIILDENKKKEREKRPTAKTFPRRILDRFLKHWTLAMFTYACLNRACALWAVEACQQCGETSSCLTSPAISGHVAIWNKDYIHTEECSGFHGHHTVYLN